MNDNDIIKALECCKDRRCDICVRQCNHFADESICRLDLIEHAFYLINRQKAKIEGLEGESNETFHKWEILVKSTKDHYAELYEEAKGIVRAEAIKEFAERIEPKLSHNTDISAVGYQSVIADIQSVVKEMTDGKDGNV